MPGRSRTEKVEIVFNAEDRQQFLTGFRKRKLERRQKAKLEAEKKYKDEISKIKKRKRDELQKRLEDMTEIRATEFGQISSLNKNHLDSSKPQVIELENHTVTVTSAEEIDLSKEKDTFFLGENCEVTEGSVDIIELRHQSTELEEDYGDGGEIKTTNIKSTSKREHRQNVKTIATLNRKKSLFNKGKQKVKRDLKAQKSMKKYLHKKRKQKQRNSKKTPT